MGRKDILDRWGTWVSGFSTKREWFKNREKNIKDELWIGTYACWIGANSIPNEIFWIQVKNNFSIRVDIAQSEDIWIQKFISNKVKKYKRNILKK